MDNTKRRQLTMTELKEKELTETGGINPLKGKLLNEIEDIFKDADELHKKIMVRKDQVDKTVNEQIDEIKKLDQAELQPYIEKAEQAVTELNAVISRQLKENSFLFNFGDYRGTKRNYTQEQAVEKICLLPIDLTMMEFQGVAKYIFCDEFAKRDVLKDINRARLTDLQDQLIYNMCKIELFDNEGQDTKDLKEIVNQHLKEIIKINEFLRDEDQVPF